MTCREVIEFLLDYEEGALAEEVRARFDEHVAGCRECVEYLRSYRAMVEAAKASMSDESLSNVPEALVQAILSARRGEPQP